MKGWTVTVNGRAVSVTTISGVYQRVDLPEGSSVVRYSFTPPHEELALFTGALALVFLVGSIAFESRPLALTRRPKREETTKDSTTE